MFAVTSTGITLWYISDHILMKSDASSIVKVLSQVGLPAGIITVIIFLLVVFCLKKIKNPFLITLTMSLVFVLFVFLSYWFILHMVFYEIDGKEPFINGLLQF